MQGFVAFLATCAFFSTGLRSSVAGEEMHNSSAAGLNSSVTRPGSSEEADGGGAGRAGCPERCRCEVDGLLHRVDCSDQGLREIPSNLSVFTSYLDLSMNNLTVLSSGDFSNLHFLEELRLAGNDLSFIPRGAFSGLYNLKVLMLQNNQLRSVPDEAFNNLHNLQSLRLDANHISSVPSGCFSGLRSLRHLWLDDNSLTEVPVAALNELPALQAMTLALNHISHVPDHAFSKLGRLVVLDLNYNSLVEFPMAIRSLSHLKELGFHSNNIQSIPEHAFTGNPSLITIFFYDNPIQSVGRSAFQNLPELRTLSLNGAADLTEFPDLTGTKSLESLTITGAQITSLPSSVCEQLPNLELLDLSYNQIQTLPSFSGCESIQKIDLHHNEIQELEENTFHGLMSLCSLDLSWNRVSSVKPNSFSALPALSKLDLSSNQLSSLPLMSLQSLTHLRLAGNDELMELIPRENLPRVRVMELPYAFQCCAFVSCERRGGSSWEREEVFGGAADSSGRDSVFLSSQVDQDWEDLLMEFDDEPKPQHSVHCSPAPGPFRPCLHLLGSWLIRGGVWLIASLSLISNCLVALSVFLSPATSVMPPKLLIGLLALVNGLMGVWSGWLAAVDAWTFGSFWRYGAAWESSFLCRLSGFLCVFASQTGLFLLTVAALERCLAATARHHKDEGQNGGSSLALFVRLAIFLCFLLGLAITLPPLVTGHSSTSLCLLLPSSSSSSSVAFSVFLVLLDSLCFLIMTFAYTRLYCRANKTPPTSEEDAALTRHVAWLLFSDCLLYLPVAFLSFSSLLHLPAAGPDAAKAVLLLVAPLPACINPLLYLLFNPHAREELAALAKRTCGAVVVSVSRGRRPGSRSRLDPLDLVYDEDAEKQSCDSTQALVAVGGTKEDEEEGRGTSETQHSVAFVVPRH
ncbi:leucine-rich repeat-containing G-protein coupled receptor 5-like isoform X2 [Sphaeramia orbicularis]|uniref:leucine-rich repeat-containing G-protein coupled receptor 5-like isoform X2 n=1 Tax=Sphaeramia orbicularis TaxID=375764 RepID=UPI001180F577|nr:leucine-rich repeat-containing G-protein coupled receptor 5 isoform X2 [Sphaeramia orbicularis]